MIHDTLTLIACIVHVPVSLIRGNGQLAIDSSLDSGIAASGISRIGAALSIGRFSLYVNNAISRGAHAFIV